MLTTERPVGMAAGHIPVSKIRAYAREQLGFEGDLEERFVSIVRRLDDECLRLAAPTKDGTKDKPLRNEVAASDVDGARAMFRGMMNQKPDKPARKPAKAKSL